MKTITKKTKTTTSMLIATILLTAVVAIPVQNAQAIPTTITLISGNGAIGNPDSDITMILGPANAPFVAAFINVDFTNAIAGSSPAIIDNHGAWKPTLDNDITAQYISTSPTGAIEGGTALLAQPFEVDCDIGVASANLLFDFHVDNELGDTNNEGLFINGNPVTSSKLLGVVVGNFNTDQQLGPFDITSDVQQGTNHMFVNYADGGGPSGIQYSATIEYECVGIEKEFADTDLLPLPDFLPVKSEVGTTMLWFNLTYAGPLANVTDAVPAEWDVIEFTGPSAGECTHETSNKKNNEKSSTQILCEDQTNVDLTVKLSTRESPSNGKGNPNKLDKWKPTSCGTVYANDGAYAFTLENGVFTLIDNVGPLWLTAAEDSVDGLSNCDGDSLLDFEDACPDVFDDGTDTDSDGVPDACDNAPGDENPRQADFDKDGVGDVADNCFFEPNANQADTDSNGLGDACNTSEDADGDEWADGLDNCPADANPGQEDTDSNGLGDACNTSEDADGDEWADGLDNCPAVFDPTNLCL